MRTWLVAAYGMAAILQIIVISHEYRNWSVLFSALLLWFFIWWLIEEVRREQA